MNNLHLTIEVEMKKNAAILVFILQITFSCTMNIVDQPKEIIHVDLESNINNFKSLKLSDVASKIEYIPLDSPTDFLLKGIKSIDINNNYILVADYEKIGLFNRNGTFITEIGEQGEGPGEFHIAGVPYIVDDNIYVPSVIGNPNILVYDITGKFTKAFAYPNYHISPVYTNWLPISKNEFLLQVPNQTGVQDFRIIKVDCQGMTLKGFPNSGKFHPFNPNIYSSDDQSGQFYIYGEKIRYKEVRNDTIWELSDDKLKAHYILYRGHFGLNFDFRSVPDEKLSKNEIRIARVFETRKYIFYETLLFGKLYPFDFYMEYNIIIGKNRELPLLGVYNKQFDDAFFVKPSNINESEFPPGIPTGLENDIDGGVNFFPKQSVSDSVLVSWIDAYKLIEYTNSDIYKKSADTYGTKRAELEKILNKLTANDNPVLIIAKLK